MITNFEITSYEKRVTFTSKILLIEDYKKRARQFFVVPLKLSTYFVAYKLANFSNKRIIWQVKPYSLSYQATVLTN